jgi:hypothetical protein
MVIKVIPITLLGVPEVGHQHEQPSSGPQQKFDVNTTSTDPSSTSAMLSLGATTVRAVSVSQDQTVTDEEAPYDVLPTII